MDKLKLKITGNKNIQVGVNNGSIIQTQKVINRTTATPNPEIHISDEQAFYIKEKVDELVDIVCKAKNVEKKEAYSEVYGSLKHHFKVTGYKFIPKDKFVDATRYLEQLKVLKYRSALKKTDNAEYRKQLYKAIHAKANELGWDNDTLYNFINTLLVPKKPILSLKELSDTRLKKIYTKLFSK